MNRPLNLLEIAQALLSPPAPSWAAAGIYASFVAMILVLSIILPGDIVQGQPFPKVWTVPGKPNRKTYKLNGLLVALTLYVLYIIGGLLKIWPLTLWADHFGDLAVFVFLVVLTLSTYLYVSAKVTGRGHFTKSFALDFWSGVELNPSIAGVDLKMFALKLAMTGWILMNISFVGKQYELYGVITNRMMLYQAFTFIYMFDYYFFENAMLSTWDIISEHWGFMLVFGDLWWMVFAFSVQNFYLLHELQPLSTPAVIGLLIFFSIGYTIFRISNYQKNQYKTNPSQPLIFTKGPPNTIEGRLLVSGLWGVVRKPNYVGDWVIAISFSLPCGFSHVFPYLYPIYLIILNIHRAIRDDEKCAEKYKEAWQKYRQRVPYYFFPKVV
jgi:delta14-sterol reductase